jgi:hypothetical protein
MTPARTSPQQTPRALPVLLLVALVVGIVAVAFRGSWGALRDAALAAHMDRDAANLYPFAVDGLMIVAMVSAVLLRHDRVARRYCLGVIAGYTVASWYMNFLHGLGQFTPDPLTGLRPVPPWYVVFVIASLVIGSIFLGSHLLVFVWRHLYPTARPDHQDAEALHGATAPYRDATPVVEVFPSNLELARAAYRESLAPGMAKLSQRAMVDRFRITVRQARTVQDEVERDLADEGPVEAPTEGPAVPERHTPNGRVHTHTGATPDQ